MTKRAPRVNGPLWVRFAAKIQLDPKSGCWIWTASLNEDGYGRILVDRKSRRAYQVAYEMFVGAVPLGLELDHLCRRRACVNPFHLEPVTHTENVLRGDSPQAKNARKTHCSKGHPYDEYNTKRIPSRPTGRWCKQCQRDWWKGEKNARVARTKTA